MTEPVHLRILSPGLNWIKIGALLALGLDGYYSKLPKGSTVAAVTADPGPSCTDGPRLVAEGKYDMAITTPAWYGQMAHEGRGFFDTPLPLRALAVLPHDDRLIMAVREETGITSLEDIARRRMPLRFSTPPPEMRHPASVVANQVLQAYGTSFEDIESWGGRLLRDRPRNQNNAATPAVDPSFDAIFDEAIMTHRWQRIFTEHKMRVLPIADEVLDSFVSRGFQRGVITPDRLPGLSEEIPTLDFSGWLLFCRANLPDEIAYLTIAGLEEQREAIQQAFPDFRSGMTGKIDLAMTCQNTGLPLHPGAEQYYREHNYLKTKEGVAA